MGRDVLDSYRSAAALWLPLLSVHLFVRLITVAVVVPVAGFLLALSLSFADQTAVTDQDIARFLLTPVGAVGALGVVSLLLVAAVIDLAAMTAILRFRKFRPTQAMASALHFLVGVFPRLFNFALRLLVRVLLISLPFAVIPAGVAFAMLREFDINYYLAERPVEFQLTIGVAALFGILLAVFLLVKLSSWAMSLHISLFGKATPAQSFSHSETGMLGHRKDLLRQVIVWFALRAALVSLVGAITGVLLAEIPQLLGDTPRAFYAVTTLIVLLWIAVSLLLVSISNGALAVILNDNFERHPAPEGASLQETPIQKPRGVLAIVLVFGASIISLLAGGLASNQFGGVGEVEVIGHRGAAALRPENTMAAIEKAVEDQADWVEIDVQETKDGHVIVVHDSDFMKAAGNPTKVWDVTLDEASEIDIGSWFDPAYSSERPPLLSEALEAVKGRSKLLIELKYYGHDEDLENRVISLVEDAGMIDDIATMSLKYPAVQKMKSLRPDWRAGVLAATSVGDLSGLEGDFLAVSAASVSPRLLARAHIAGKDVYVWTVNDAPLMSRMISIGVDGLITDDPALANEVIDHYKTLSTPERLMFRLADRIGFAFDLTPGTETSDDAG